MTESIFGFRPVRGLENKILANPIEDGNLYFATDTGKIYLDRDTERVALGGSGAAIYYATATDIIHNPAYDTYTLKFADMDDQNAIPKEDDLIINSNGRFFKVNWYDVVSGQINCKLIAVSGTGGGSGGGGEGSGGGTDERDLIVTVNYPGKTFVYGSEYFINITASSKIDRYLDIEYKIFDIRGTAIYEKLISFNSGDTVALDIGNNIKEPGTYGITYRITGANSNSYERTISGLQCIDLRLEADSDNFTSYKIYDKSFQYALKVYGISTKTLHIKIDNINLEDITLDSSENDKTKTITINPLGLNLEAGVHTITSYLSMGTVVSNTIETDFIYHPAGTEDTTYVLVSSYPTKAYTYETPIVNYWVYDTSKEIGATNIISLSVNGVEIEKVTHVQQENKGLTWNVTNLIEGNNNCVIQCGPGSRSFVINAEVSTIFDQITDAAVLLLDTTGRTNSTSLERRLTWEYTDIDGVTTKAQLNNFNWYNNGWFTDTNGRSCLRISNDASVEIPLNLFTASNPTIGGYTLEFEFKPYNLYSYQLLTAGTTIEGEDEEVVISRVFDISKASIVYAQGEKENAYGFALGTQDAYFRMSEGAHVTARYKDEEIINVAVVINAASQQISMYINGVMSGVTQYSNISEKLPTSANAIKINSQYCDIDLYNIRVYNKVLNSNEIVQNYIASKKDLDLYNQNRLATGAIVDLNTIVEYNKNNPDNATIPYMVIKTNAPDILPYFKDNDDVICDMEFINPALDRAYELGNITSEDYIKNAPSFLATAVKLNVQGTSSQKYPRKNFKGKMLKTNSSKIEIINENIPEEERSLSKISLAPGIAEKTFTWKVDYMDSAGRHNTGFCSYVKELYTQHPLDYYGIDGSKYRTTIYGFPVLMFHEKSNGKVEFIGRYNFNLDKSCENSLGMTLSDKHPILTDKTIEEVAECWEFANNKGGRCSFKGQPFDYGYNPVTQTGKLDLLTDLEPRYHINGDAIENAFDLKAEDGETPIEEVEAFELLLGSNRDGAYSNLEKVFIWLQNNHCAFDLASQEDQAKLKELLGRQNDIDILATDEDYITFQQERITNFRQNFTKHFNLEYSLVYYIMTELLVQFDSRGKNMMLASWGPQEENGEYIWFPIYYDVDTQLGVNNSGVPSWEYDVEPTDEKQFSTPDSLLWNSLRVAFDNEIQSKYKDLRGKKLTIGDLNGYYNFDAAVSGAYAMKGVLPINIINADMTYKYILPSTEGYITGIDANKAPIYDKTNGYFYCLQGTRDLYRALFLRNRFNYYDSKWKAQSYDPSTTGASLRWRANSNADTVGTDLAANLILNIKPKLNQYIVVWMDEDATGNKTAQIKARANEIVTINIKDYDNTIGENYNQQLIYFGGAENIQEYGNVSLLYLDEFQLTKPSVAAIELGNDNPNYVNPAGNKLAGLISAATYVLDPNDETDSNRKPMLKLYDITNLKDMTGIIHLATSPKLEIFKALGTNITGVEFAAGANLQQVLLPQTIQSLKLIETASLNRIVNSKDDITTDNSNGLYIENLIQTNDEGQEFTNLNTLNIVGGNLGYYSYDLLNKIASLKNDNDTLAINLEEVNWSPYSQLGEGAVYTEYDSSLLYYAENNCTFSPYSYTTPEAWITDLAGGRIYYKGNTSAINITNLALLDMIKDNNYFNGINEGTKPNITGIIYIDNSFGESISEAEIANTYNTYYPNLIIKAANVEDAYRARFVYLDKGVEKEIKVQRFDKGEGHNHIIVSPLEAELPVPMHHDFVGWKYMDASGKEQIVDNDYFDSNTFEFSALNDEYVFEMVYEPHVYTITYVDGNTYSQEIKVEYNHYLKLPNLIPQRDETQIPLEMRYAFQGWTNKKDVDSVVLPSQVGQLLVDPTTILASMDLTFYAVFTEENVYSNHTDYKYFTFTTIDGGYTDSVDTTFNVSGPTAAIGLSPYYAISGKITLPTHSPEGYPITHIAPSGFKANLNITCIFSMPESKLRVISNAAFQYSTSLSYVELPEGLRSIGDYAFYSCTRLYINKTYLDDGNIYIGNNIINIEQHAFNGAFAPASKATNYYIGGNIQKLGAAAFQNNDIFKDILYIGSANEPSQLIQVDFEVDGDSPFKQNSTYYFNGLEAYAANDTAQQLINAIVEAGGNVFNPTTTSSIVS